MHSLRSIMVEPVKRIDGRYAWIDNLRAIAILLVVFGHVFQYFPGMMPLYRVIYSFHMPLFFAITGYLLKEDFNKVSVRVYLWRKAKALMLPYAMFGILRLAFGVISKALPTKICDIVKMILMCRDSYLNLMWFLPCLFTALILIYFIFKIKISWLRWALIWFCVILGLLLRDFKVTAPLNLEVALVAVFYIALGNLLKLWGKYEKNMVWILSLLVFVGTNLLALEVNAASDLFYDLAFTWFFPITSISGIVFWFGVTKRFLNKSFPILTFFGVNSVYFYGFHYYGIGIFNLIYNKYSQIILMPALDCILGIIIALLVSCALVYAYRLLQATCLYVAKKFSNSRPNRAT